MVQVVSSAILLILLGGFHQTIYMVYSHIANYIANWSLNPSSHFGREYIELLSNMSKT